MEHLIGEIQLPLLPLVGKQGEYSGKAYLGAVKAICKAVARIEGPLKMAGRNLLVMVPDSPNIFGGGAGLDKARSVIWQAVEDSPHIIFGFLTDTPAAIKPGLPADWTGNGYRNVVIGTRVDGPEHLTTRLEALRSAPVRCRMLVVGQDVDVSLLAGQLAGIHWVVMNSVRGQAPQAAALAEACAVAKVPFAFFQSDEGGETDAPGPDKTRWQEHPFGPQLVLGQPPIVGVMALIAEIRAMSVQHGVAQPEFKAVLRLEPSIKPMVSPAPVVPAELPVPLPGSWRDSLGDSPGLEVSAPAELPDAVTSSTAIALEVMNPELPDPVADDANRTEFERLDRVVRSNLEAFVAAGSALQEIRDRELWHAGGHPSWAAYCSTVAGLTKTHSNRLINCVEIRQVIEQKVADGDGAWPSIMPTGEWQMRSLTRLKTPEQQAQAWFMAVERSGGQPTSTDVGKVVAELLARDGPAKSANPSRKGTLADAFAKLGEVISRKESFSEIEAAFKKFDRLFKATSIAGAESVAASATGGIRLAKSA